MPRRARWTRPVAALFALWFALVLGDPGLLHSCPTHGGHGSANATASAGAEHQMATHAEHDASRHGDHGHHGKTGPCTCVGQCCAAPALVSLPAVPPLHVPTAVALAEPTLHVAIEPAPASPASRLPFANGPPTA